MLKWFALFTLMVGYGVGYAKPRDPCELLLSAKPIPRTTQPLYPIEMDTSGAIIQSWQNIPVLRSGFYIYLITSIGEILLAPKYDVQNFLRDQKGLATHKSLLNLYVNKIGNSVEGRIVAAGEIQVAFGTAIVISNKSGSYRGDPATLTLAVDTLKSRGLWMDADSKIYAVNVARKDDRGHTPRDRQVDEYRLEIRGQVARSSEGVHLVELFERLGLLVNESFPEVRGRAAILAMMRARDRGAKLTEGYNGYSSFHYPLITAYNSDGLEFGIWALHKQIENGASQTDRYSYGVPAQIHNILLGAGDSFSANIKVKWLTLSYGFAALK